MPRDGETPLARFAHAVVREQGFSFGSPYLSDTGSEVVLPVLRTQSETRRYALAPEASDDFEATDIGRLDRLRVHNGSGVRLFLPPGTLFESRETASRALAAGIILEPGATKEVEARCVHAAAALGRGAVLKVTPKLAPYILTQAVLQGDQGLTWTVADALSGGDVARAANDWAATAFGGDVCGAFLLDTGGVVALEIWSAPGSFTSIPRTIPPAPEQAARMPLDPQGAIGVARNFLRQLPACAFRPAGDDSWIARDGLAEYTMVEGEVVHLLGFGRDLARLPPARTAAPLVVNSGITTGPGAGLSAQAWGMSGEGEVASASISMVETSDTDEGNEPVVRHRRKKVLTSGWDSITFEALERYSAKEFGGDRSAALRSLAWTGLTRRGYLGPLPHHVVADSASQGPSGPPPLVEGLRAAQETRIHDLECVAENELYAAWLRKRARLELERLAEAPSDERLRDAARAALERLTPLPPPEPVPGPEEPEELEEPEEREEPEEPTPPAPPTVDVAPLLRRAVMASASGEYDDALSLFDEVLEAEPVNLTALLGRAVTLRRSGKAQEALAGLDIVLRLDPDNAAAHLNRGRILQERGDLRGALDAFDRLAAVAPNDWDVWMERGDVLARMGRAEDALQSFSEALKRNPDDEKLKRRVEALERTRDAEPVPVKIEFPAGIEEGQSYVAEGGHEERVYGAFRSLAAQRLPALLITRHPPDQVRKDPALAAVHVAHLYHGTGPEAYSPEALASLARLVERFVEEHHGQGVILLDGLELIVASTSFRDALLFVEHINELALQRRVVFLLALARGGLNDRERALLERSLRVLA